MPEDPLPLPEKRPINPWTLWIPIIMIVLGVVVLYNYLIFNSMQAKEDKITLADGSVIKRPPFLGRLEKDMTFTERSGKTVNLSELKGKILIASWVFTRCPRGCAGVLAKLKKLHDEFGANPGIQFLSFTLDPEDTPEMMRKFADGIGIKETAPWWFLNGDKKIVRNFMTFSMKFRPVQDLPEADRMTPDDKYIHDLRVAIVDHRGHLRGLYDVMNADADTQTFYDKMLRDELRYFLDEQKKDTP
jgi:cytochrome oxidase Cu insertion factor (SCO1/SenC/PrrC family)